MDVEKSSGFHLAVFYFSACEKKGCEGVCVCVCLHRAAGWTAAHKLPAEAFYFIFLHGQFFNQTGLPVENVIFLLKFCLCKIEMCIFIVFLCYYFLQGVCVYFYLDVQTLISPLWYSQWVVTKQLTTNLLVCEGTFKKTIEIQQNS